MTCDQSRSPFRGQSAPVVVIILVVILLAVTAASGAAVYPSDNLSAWARVAPLPEASDSGASVVVGDWLYLLGGRNSASDAVDTVRRALTLANGTLETWIQDSAERLPKPLYAHTALAVDNRIYVVGGYTGSYERAAYVSLVNADGSLSAWQSAGHDLPDGQERATHAAAAARGYLYVLGGYRYPNALDGVWRAAIQPDGSLGVWEQDAQSLPLPLFRLNAVSDGGVIYVVGGRPNPSDSTTSRRIYRATVGADGHLGQWQNLGDLLPEGRADHIALVDQGKLFVIGGTNGVAPQSTVYVYEIGPAGLIPLLPDRLLPQPRTRAAGAVSQNHALYVIGGLDGATQQNTVYMTRAPAPGLTLSLTSNRHGPLHWGDDIEYRIRFENGPALLENVTITNTLPVLTTGAITVTSISVGGRQEGAEVRWPPWPLLAPGWSAELTYTVRISATMLMSPTLCGDAILVNLGAYAAWTRGGLPGANRSEHLVHGCTIYAPLIAGPGE